MLTEAQYHGAASDPYSWRLAGDEKPEAVGLDKLEEKMRSKEPPFERLPMLGPTGAPLMVVHRSVLNDFLLKKKAAEPDKNAKDYKLSDLVAEYPWLTKIASRLCLRLAQRQKPKPPWHKKKAALTYLLPSTEHRLAAQLAGSRTWICCKRRKCNCSAGQAQSAMQFPTRSFTAD